MTISEKIAITFGKVNKIISSILSDVAIKNSLYKLKIIIINFSWLIPDFETAFYWNKKEYTFVIFSSSFNKVILIFTVVRQTNLEIAELRKSSVSRAGNSSII